MTDEHTLTGVLVRQRIPASVEAPEAVEASLAWNQLAKLVTGDVGERCQSFLRPEIQRPSLCCGMNAGIGGMREPVTCLRIQIGKSEKTRPFRKPSFT